MRLKEDTSSWNASAVRRRDARADRSSPEVARTGSRRKDTKRWCKGKVGREHIPGDPESYRGLSNYQAVCCVNCGKILDIAGPDRTPKLERYRTS